MNPIRRNSARSTLPGRIPNTAASALMSIQTLGRELPLFFQRVTRQQPVQFLNA
jgi:hypothetical protein